jgi:hypothetical protein
MMALRVPEPAVAPVVVVPVAQPARLAVRPERPVARQLEPAPRRVLPVARLVVQPVRLAAQRPEPEQQSAARPVAQVPVLVLVLELAEQPAAQRAELEPAERPARLCRRAPRLWLRAISISPVAATRARFRATWPMSRPSSSPTSKKATVPSSSRWMAAPRSAAILRRQPLPPAARVLRPELRPPLRDKHQELAAVRPAVQAVRPVARVRAVPAAPLVVVPEAALVQAVVRRPRRRRRSNNP